MTLEQIPLVREKPPTREHHRRSTACTPAKPKPVSQLRFLTNAPRWHGPFLDARHRARGRCENRIKTLKNTGLGKLPFYDFAANQAWAHIAALASNLTSWLQLAALPDGHHAKGWDIKRWRYRLFATAGKIITCARKTTLLIPAVTPESATITTLQATIKNLAARLRHRPGPLQI